MPPAQTKKVKKFTDAGTTVTESAPAPVVSEGKDTSTMIGKRPAANVQSNASKMKKMEENINSLKPSKVPLPNTGIEDPKGLNIDEPKVIEAKGSTPVEKNDLLPVDVRKTKEVLPSPPEEKPDLPVFTVDMFDAFKNDIMQQVSAGLLDVRTQVGSLSQRLDEGHSKFEEYFEPKVARDVTVLLDQLKDYNKRTPNSAWF